MDKTLIPKSEGQEKPDAAVFYKKMKGDYYRYLCEVLKCDGEKEEQKQEGKFAPFDVKFNCFIPLFKI